MSDTAVLRTTGLVAGYERDLPIVRVVDFALGADELVVVLGPNGAGKSTFVKAIAGLVPIHAGTVRLGHTDTTHVPAHEKIRHGLAFVPQTENVFATLSIADNLRLAADILPAAARAVEPPPGFSDWPAVVQRAKGQTVYWRAWAGDQKVNDFIAWAAGVVRDRYAIQLRHVKEDDSAAAVTNVACARLTMPPMPVTTVKLTKTRARHRPAIV